MEQHINPKEILKNTFNALKKIAAVFDGYSDTASKEDITYLPRSKWKAGRAVKAAAIIVWMTRFVAIIISMIYFTFALTVPIFFVEFHSTSIVSKLIEFSTSIYGSLWFVFLC